MNTRLLTIINVVSSLITIWTGLIIPIYEKYLSNMNYENYFQQNWLMLLGIFGMMTSMLLGLAQQRKDGRRLKRLEDILIVNDQIEMDHEMLNAVGFWIDALNKTKEERDAYIHQYFPRNEDKIQYFLNQHYPK